MENYEKILNKPKKKKKNKKGIKFCWPFKNQVEKSRVLQILREDTKVKN